MRVLQATKNVNGFRNGINRVKLNSGRTSPFLESVLSATDSQLNTVFAVVYSKYITKNEIDKLVLFYESATGRYIINKPWLLQ